MGFSSLLDIILLIRYKILHCLLTTYFSSFITLSQQSRFLHFFFFSHFYPRLFSSRMGDRRFQSSPPNLEQIALRIRSSPSISSFKRSLKTRLYSVAFLGLKLNSYHCLVSYFLCSLVFESYFFSA